MSVRIFAMTHKQFDVPKEELYIPMHVGHAQAKQEYGYLGDDTGDNISDLNCYYAELSGVYWVWKNYTEADYVGICHYRRFLTNEENKAFTQEQYEALLQKYDLITTKQLELPNSYHYGFGAHHKIETLDETGRIISEIYPKYYDYFFKYQYWIKAMFIHGKGVSFDNRWTLNWETMASYKLPFPQFEEQKKIAVFLDKECSKIDEIIQENNKEIALLTEYKDTVIEKHIMGRENKYHKLDEPTPWLQQIPNDWIVYKMKHLANIIMGQSPNGDDIKNSGDTPFMQGNKEFGIKYPNTSLFCDNYKKKSRIGDILMSVRAPVGAINESDKEYGIGRGLCSIRPDSSIIIKDFMKYVLIANKNKFSYYSNGSTFDAITIEALKNLKIMVPSIDVQENIVNTLNKTCSKIDDVIEYRKKIIIKLEEYKKSLIYEYVMGKKEV